MQTVTWNTFRYRNSFDPNYNFDTPQLATGFTCKVDAQRAITFKVERNRRDGTPSSTPACPSGSSKASDDGDQPIP